MLPLELVRIFADACDRLRLAYFVTGSVASSYYGEYRSTLDVDIVVELPSWQVRGLCDAFPSPDWYMSEGAAMDATRRPGMFSIIHNGSGLKIDVVVFAGTPFDESRLARAKARAVKGVGAVMFASPEDVLLKKLVYFKEGGSDKHLRDITSMYRVAETPFDWSYIDDWAPRLGVEAEVAALKAKLGVTGPASPPTSP